METFWYWLIHDQIQKRALKRRVVVVVVVVVVEAAAVAVH